VIKTILSLKIACVLLYGTLAFSQGITVSAHANLVSTGSRIKNPQSSNVLIWLTPIGNPQTPLPPAVPSMNPARLSQHNKSFSPHLLVVPVGSQVEFPNRDPFFHNVFSLFEGKRFDLGLYEAGTTRRVRFDKPGISYIFCNIHAEMSAVVVALSTPYYGISNNTGELIIPHVPAGRYTLRVWYETALSEALDSMTREITVSDDQSSLGVFRIPAASLPPSHKNKYGKDYEPPTPNNPAYEHQ
jgi:plastocyanin